MSNVPMCLVGRITRFRWSEHVGLYEIPEDDAAVATAKAQGWAVFWRSSWLTPSQLPETKGPPTQQETD
jgi:hypothetical protein